MFAAVCEVVSPITSPSPACRHMRASSATVVVLPEPAGPARTSARRAEVSTQNAAAAWSGRSPHPVSPAPPRRARFRGRGALAGAPGELRFEPRLVRAQQPRRGGRGQARRAGRGGVGQEPRLQVELRPGRVPRRAMRDVQALAGGAAQAVRHARPLRRRQQDRALGDCLPGQRREQRGGILRGHRADVRGQPLAQVTDQVRLSPGRLRPLNRSNSFGDEPLGLRRGQRRSAWRSGVEPMEWHRSPCDTAPARTALWASPGAR